MARQQEVTVLGQEPIVLGQDLVKCIIQSQSKTEANKKHLLFHLMAPCPLSVQGSSCHITCPEEEISEYSYIKHLKPRWINTLKKVLKLITNKVSVVWWIKM